MDTEELRVGIFISLQVPRSLTVHCLVPVLLSCKPSLLSWKGSYQNYWWVQHWATNKKCVCWRCGTFGNKLNHILSLHMGYQKEITTTRPTPCCYTEPFIMKFWSLLKRSLIYPLGSPRQREMIWLGVSPVNDLTQRVWDYNSDLPSCRAEAFRPLCSDNEQ